MLLISNIPQIEGGLMTTFILLNTSETSSEVHHQRGH